MKTLKTTLIFAFIMAWIPLISKAQQPEVTIEFENAATAIEVVQNYTAALQAGNVDKMDALLHNDIIVYGLGGGLDSLTKAQHKEYYTTSTSQYKHSLSNELYLPVKVTNNWNEGEWVLAWGTNTITNKETGKIIEIPYHTASRVVDGKITFVHYWYDMLNILRQQGYEIKPPSN
ncbi:nuclear transport factor 2 family protein [Algoriphagus sp. D3-2-R+10]|uniref:nuclear transport factor 2 family protein n=1 Tax=Algoriphagus aurantiacus TaxID=3103948 RepID=UPI002B383481|nr:nuclear transport factor 2 family protein [Algoriphagus sp. D3-2-R+10]MEB2777055.1 nuclear transport factor 2 family protein [Algoriphagus sp. D3-2-R+10]